MNRKALAAMLLGMALGAQTWSAGLDLRKLPAYSPELAVAGSLRVVGSGHAGMVEKWQDGYRKFHPEARFINQLITSDAAIPALISGIADLAPDGGEPSITETLGFFETYGHHPLDIIVATGAFDAEGRSNAIVVYVHRDNPINELSIDQLDGIFGAERRAGLRGFKWTLADGRGPEQNLRSWGQLGLQGAWTRKAIQTYGHAPSGTTRFFQRMVLGNSEKWNPNIRQGVESGSKMIGADDPGQQGGMKYLLSRELAHNPYGIAWTVAPQAADIPGLKLLAIAPRGGGAAVLPSAATVQDRSYPLTRSIYIYVNRAPGAPLDRNVREFLRFVLSREGQQIVADSNGHLPLTGELLAEQRRKLE
jgi:phosphate transport system substrate-binding protein